MFLKNVKYITSAPSKEFYPKEVRNEICILGRSNVGKSTLINLLTNDSTVAKVSSKPGYTKYLNFFDVDNKYYLVDSPGYGFAKANYQTDASFEKMMNEYLYKREKLIYTIVLIDGKVGFTNDDLLVLDMLKNANRKVQIFVSKIDKTNQSQRHQFNIKAKEILDEVTYANMLTYSALDKRSVEKIIDRIITIYNENN